MVSAASAGRIDYTKADSNSSKWIIQENLILANFERELLAEAYDKRHLQHMLSASGWSIWSENGKLVGDQVAESQKHLRKAEQLMLPWLALGDAGYNTDYVAKLRDEYISKYGDPADADVKEKIQRTRDQVKRRELEAQQKEEKAKQELEVRKRKLSERRNRFRKIDHGRKRI